MELARAYRQAWQPGKVGDDGYDAPTPWSSPDIALPEAALCIDADTEGR